MDETGKREFRRSGAAADGFFRLHEKDRSEFSRERDGRSQPVGPRAHDDGIVMISLKGHGPSTSDETDQID